MINFKKYLQGLGKQPNDFSPDALDDVGHNDQ